MTNDSKNAKKKMGFALVLAVYNGLGKSAPPGPLRNPGSLAGKGLIDLIDWKDSTDSTDSIEPIY